MSEGLSQEVIDFLKELMTLRFPSVQNHHPDKVTVRVQDGLVITEMWSKTGQLIISEENSMKRVMQLSDLIKDPQRRAQTLTLFSESITSSPSLH